MNLFGWCRCRVFCSLKNNCSFATHMNIYIPNNQTTSTPYVWITKTRKNHSRQCNSWMWRQCDFYSNVYLVKFVKDYYYCIRTIVFDFDSFYLVFVVFRLLQSGMALLGTCSAPTSKPLCTNMNSVTVNITF